MSLPMAANRSQNFNVNNNNTSLNNPKRAKLVGENWHHNSSRGGGATKPHLNEMDSDPPNEDAANKRATSLPPNIGSLTSRNVIYLDMRNRNIKMDGAYSVSQVIKTENSTLEVVDISENNLEDDGLMYISIALKMCKFLKSLNLSSAAFTEYGLRILLENLNSSHLKYLNVSGNLIGNKGIEHLVKFLPSSKLDHLSLNSIGIDDEGAKLLGFAMSTNSTVRILEIGWNNIKQIGAVAISRGLVANSQIEELYMTCNSFGVDGSSSLSECLKINRSLRSIDLSNNRLNYDSAKVIASALRQNSTLRFLNLSQNNISISGVYDLLSAINSESSGLEYLGLKSIPIQKNLVLLVELIQQRRRFTCDYGSVIIYPDASSSKLFTEDESMIKLARYLSDKRLRLVDMFRILDKDSSLEINKNDFKRRLKIFEPRLTPKDIIAITKNLCNNKEFINYSSLLNQTSKRFDIEGEITRRRAQINVEDERSTKVFKAQANNNPKQSQNQEEPPKADLIPTRESFETNIKERSIDSPSINLSPNNSSSTYRSVNSKTKLKPISDSSVISSNASSTISNKRNYRINKNFRSVDNINNKSQEKEQNFSSA